MTIPAATTTFPITDTEGSTRLWAIEFAMSVDETRRANEEEDRV